MSSETLLEELRERLRRFQVAASNGASTTGPVPTNALPEQTSHDIEKAERSNQETHQEPDIANKRKKPCTKWLYIYSGPNKICRLPRDLFFKISTETPPAGLGHVRMNLPADLDPDSFEHIWGWLSASRRTGVYTRIPYFDNLFQDLALCRAARFLGLQDHVQYIHNFYWAYFKKKHIPDYEDLEVIVALHQHGHEDPFMRLVATRLGHLKYHGEIPDLVEFEEWLMLHPVLKSKVEEVVEGLEKVGREKGRRPYTGVGSAWIDGNGWAL